MITFEDIKKANSTIQTMAIERKDKKTGKTVSKDYAEVPQRIKAFRMNHPLGSIVTELVSDDGEKCIFKAEISDENGNILGTGTAFELKTSSFINQSSYIENCETSAVGRALAMCGYGIDVSIASYEEVANAMQNQKQEEPKGITKEERIEQLHEVPGYPSKEEMLNEEKKFYENKPEDLEKLYKYWKVKSLDDLTAAQLAVLYKKHHK